MSAALNIAILGAGYVGSAAARMFAAEGAAVWAVRRSVAAPEPGITWVHGDITGALPAALPAELDAVLLTIAPSAVSDGYDATYPPAASRALELARRTGAGAVIYTSSTGVYGGAAGEWVDEASPRRGAGPGNRALIDAEDRLLHAGLPGVTVFRVAGIYGPGRDPRGRFAAAGALPMRGEYWVNLAHQQDIVRALHSAATYRAQARALNLSDGAPALAADVARWLAGARGEDPDGLRFGNDATRSRSNQRVDTQALRDTGFVPAFPSFREGFTLGL